MSETAELSRPIAALLPGPIPDDRPDYDTLIEMTHTAMIEDGLSQNAAAHQIGYKSPTISAWLNKKYVTGNVDNICAGVWRWLKARGDSRKRHVARRTQSFVETNAAQIVANALHRAQFEPLMITITGDPGVGKTSAMREYQRTHNNVFLFTASVLVASPKAIMGLICDELKILEGAPYTRPKKIGATLAGRDALIVIDEAQHLSMPAIDQLRSLYDDPRCSVGIVLAGNYMVRRNLTPGAAGTLYAQLTSRIGWHVDLKCYGSDVDRILDAEGIVSEDARKLLRLTAAQPGALRSVDMVLRAAHILAGTEQAADVTYEHIRTAHQQRHQQLGGAA